jgi:hypothetical protein
MCKIEVLLNSSCEEYLLQKYPFQKPRLGHFLRGSVTKTFYRTLCQRAREIYREGCKLFVQIKKYEHSKVILLPYTDISTAKEIKKKIFLYFFVFTCYHEASLWAENCPNFSFFLFGPAGKTKVFSGK